MIFVGKVKKFTVTIIVVANALYFFGKFPPQFASGGKVENN